VPFVVNTSFLNDASKQLEEQIQAGGNTVNQRCPADATLSETGATNGHQ
jgi:hypothetical protein